MTNKILYIEDNYNNAATLKQLFTNKEYDLYTVKTGEEALEFLKREDKVLLLLVNTVNLNTDICKLFELADSFTDEQIIKLAIIGKNDKQLLIDLANKCNVNKIFVDTIGMDELFNAVISEIEENSIKEEISDEKVDNDRIEIENTVKSLAQILKKQQRGYSKLENFFSIFTDVLSEEIKMLPDSEKKLNFAREAFEMMLRMQTTGSFEISKLVELIREDLIEFHRVNTGFRIGRVENCIFGGITKTLAENVRYSIWLIARYYTEFYDEMKFEVTSHFLTPSLVEFTCHVTLSEKYDIAVIEAGSDDRVLYRSLVLGIIGRLTNEVRREGNERDIEVQFSIPISE